MMTGYATNPYPAPVDLSHLDTAVGALAPLRYAFLGRVSTREAQDPSSSIPGQFARATTALPPGAEFVAWYWDVESGALPLEERGQGTYDPADVNVPRTGGVADCLEAARAGHIDVVVVDEISRPAREMIASLTLEQQLDQSGVVYRVAAEPEGMERGAASVRYITRRTTQMIAEWYRLITMETSERGQREHARRGYLHGVAPYGYIAVYAPDAPVKPLGRWGSRRPRVLKLDPDERRPATVRRIFDWRTRRHKGIDYMGYKRIADRLNASPDRYPSPSGTQWDCRVVRGLLRNPKYTGYMVWNRKGSRTRNHRPKPMSEWVWSAEPTHPPIVSLETWVRAQEVTVLLSPQRTME